MAKTDAAPATKYLKDYQKPDFSIESLHLSFDIHDQKTVVTAKTAFKRMNPAAKDLTLEGQDMALRSVSLDGKKLSEGAYRLTPTQMILPNVPDSFMAEIVTEICPEKNTALEGLYHSDGNYCTQCEPEGFRKITYYLDRPDVMTTFTVRIEADAKKCPVLLSNGNRIDSGALSDGRHFAVWHDPFPKPSYLFALVAGNLAHIHDTFTTKSGRKVDLYIYANHGQEQKCHHAMASLKKSMTWDEETYGREYDLDIFNVVAVHDFNFGAMENKSLNVFNSRLVLAQPETATDADYLAIEGVIAHEYFHNWTGNRITCRDWFQLSLKEGLTVFRDQCFSGDMNSAAVQRIDDVEMLRNTQFPEDASPMAHSVRPDSYIEINNFYTATVYEKGAEVIRMMKTILGPDNYRKGTDLYFQRHDGQAVTCDDFAKCMEDASGVDLSQFKLWYSQAGTPAITARTSYDAAAQKLSLTFRQDLPETPGQKDKKPMHIPILVGLVGKDGKDLLPEKTRTLHLKEKEQPFVFDNIKERPIPSLLRGFSAPVKLTSDLTDDDLLFLMAHDSDGFNRWDAGQTYMQRLLLQFIRSGKHDVPDACFQAFHRLITDRAADKALIAKTLALPSDAYLAQLMDMIDVDGMYAARKSFMASIGKKFTQDLKKLHEDCADTGAYSISPAAIGKRALKNTALRYLEAADTAISTPLALTQYKAAQNMTDKTAALAILTNAQTDDRQKAFEDFYAAWKHEPLVIDKWFGLQAIADRDDAPELVTQLLSHPDFTYKNPNRLRSVIANFGLNNARGFHRKDGKGYQILADAVITTNAINPSTAARLLRPLRQWKLYDPHRKGMMETELRRILDQKNLSNDVYEIVAKSLG